MSDPILEVRNLEMLFPTSSGMFSRSKSWVRAVDGVSFSVVRGECFGIVGESGSGKTTLGRCIMRVLQPSKGTITFHGKNHDGSKAAALELTGDDKERLKSIWRHIRMVFQDPQSSLNPRLPVIEIVGQSLRKAEKLSGKALAERVSELLVNVGLRPEILHRYAGAFSGGQRQRLGIARALATHPQLVVADEAVSALDVSIQAQTLNLLQDLQEQFDLTYVFIAHDLAVVEHICDRVAVMYLGEIVEIADTGTLFSTPQHPYTQALLSAVPVPDPRKRRDRSKRIVTGDTTTASDTACKFAPRCPHATQRCRDEAPLVRRIGNSEVQCHFAGVQTI